MRKEGSRGLSYPAPPIHISGYATGKEITQNVHRTVKVVDQIKRYKKHRSAYRMCLATVLRSRIQSFLIQICLPQSDFMTFLHARVLLMHRPTSLVSGRKTGANYHQQTTRNSRGYFRFSSVQLLLVSLFTYNVYVFQVVTLQLRKLAINHVIHR